MPLNDTDASLLALQAHLQMKLSDYERPESQGLSRGHGSKLFHHYYP